jgi:hypothetical protein
VVPRAAPATGTGGLVGSDSNGSLSVLLGVLALVAALGGATLFRFARKG